MFKRINLLILVTVIGLALFGIAACQASTGAAPSPNNAVVRVIEDEWHRPVSRMPEARFLALSGNMDEVSHREQAFCLRDHRLIDCPRPLAAADDHDDRSLTGESGDALGGCDVSTENE